MTVKYEPVKNQLEWPIIEKESSIKQDIFQFASEKHLMEPLAEKIVTLGVSGVLTHGEANLIVSMISHFLYWLDNSKSGPVRAGRVGDDK